MLKKIIVFLTSLLLVLNSTLSNAFAIRQWGVNNPMAVGASILYDGLKGVVTSSVLITPNATQVAKVLGTGGAGFALSYAVEQLLGAVDWVLDPANNQIRYNKTTMCTGACPYSIEHVSGTYNTGEAGCKAYELYLNLSTANIKYGYTSKVSYNVDNAYPHNPGYCSGYIYTASGGLVQSVATRVRYNLNATLEEATLSLETVAQQVIENAENNNLDAQFAVLAAANNILSEAENDDAKAKPIEDELEENKNNNCNPPAGVKFNKVTHYDRHGRDPDPNVGSHGCMAKTGSPVHWHYSVNHQLPDGRCVVQKHAFGGCGVAPP